MNSTFVFTFVIVFLETLLFTGCASSPRLPSSSLEETQQSAAEMQNPQPELPIDAPSSITAKPTLNDLRGLLLR